MNTSFETTDIFRGAFFMCIGGDLESIRFRTKQIATFTFKGEIIAGSDQAKYAFIKDL